MHPEKPSYSAIDNQGNKFGRFFGSPGMVAKKIAKQSLKETGKSPKYVQFVKNDYNKSDTIYRYGVDYIEYKNPIEIRMGNKSFFKKYDIKTWRA